MNPRIERGLGLQRPLPLVRAAIADEIDRLIAAPDRLNPDLEDGADAKPCLGWRGEAGRGCPDERDHPFAVSIGQPIANDDRELENEHGGAILDEPHDGEEKEPFPGLGRAVRPDRRRP